LGGAKHRRHEQGQQNQQSRSEHRELSSSGFLTSGESSVSAKIEPNPILNRPLHTPMYVVRNLCASFFRVPRHL
jgi:hypothetical protein